MARVKTAVRRQHEREKGLSEAAAALADEQTQPRLPNEPLFALHWLPAEFWRQLTDHRDSSVAAPVRWQFRSIAHDGCDRFCCTDTR